MWQPISESHSEMQVSEYPERAQTTQHNIFIHCTVDEAYMLHHAILAL